MTSPPGVADVRPTTSCCHEEAKPSLDVARHRRGGGRVAGDSLERPQPPRLGRREDPGARARRHPANRVRSQRLGPDAPGRPVPDPGRHRARPHEPVLGRRHPRRERRGGGPGLFGAAWFIRREPRRRAEPPSVVRGASGGRRAGLVRRCRQSGNQVADPARDHRRAAGRVRRNRTLRIGVAGSGGRRPAGRRSSDQSRSSTDRLHQRLTRDLVGTGAIPWLVRSDPGSEPRSRRRRQRTDDHDDDRPDRRTGGRWPAVRDARSHGDLLRERHGRARRAEEIA